MSDELKPCPFCGGESSWRVCASLEPGSDSGWNEITTEHADGCPIEGVCDVAWVPHDGTPEAIGAAMAKAATLWNQRPIEDALRAELAEARGLLDEVWPHLCVADEVLGNAERLWRDDDQGFLASMVRATGNTLCERITVSLGAPPTPDDAPESAEGGR